MTSTVRDPRPEVTGPARLRELSRARWPESAADREPPDLAMFVLSSFSPLVAEVANRCLRRHFGRPPVDPAAGARTGVLLVSAAGDITTATAVADAVDAGRRLTPMLFFQSVPNAAVGHVTGRWGLTGPVVCLSPPVDAATGAGPTALEDGALAYAAELIEDGDADRVLVLLVEQGPADGTGDRAVAVLVQPEGARPDRARSDGAGLDAAGLDGAGLDAAGLDAAGSDGAGLDAAGLDRVRPGGARSVDERAGGVG